MKPSTFELFVSCKAKYSKFQRKLVQRTCTDDHDVYTPFAQALKSLITDEYTFDLL